MFMDVTAEPCFGLDMGDFDFFPYFSSWPTMSCVEMDSSCLMLYPCGLRIEYIVVVQLSYVYGVCWLCPMFVGWTN
jgi:hypothetical protein